MDFKRTSVGPECTGGVRYDFIQGEGELGWRVLCFLEDKAARLNHLCKVVQLIVSPDYGLGLQCAFRSALLKRLRQSLLPRIEQFPCLSFIFGGNVSQKEKVDVRGAELSHTHIFRAQQIRIDNIEMRVKLFQLLLTQLAEDIALHRMPPFT